MLKIFPYPKRRKLFGRKVGKHRKSENEKTNFCSQYDFAGTQILRDWIGFPL